MRVFEDPLVLSEHKWSCRLSCPTPLGTVTLSYIKPYTHNPVQEGIMHGGRREAVALDCEMVGGGSDGSLDICVRVCLIDEDENVIFHSYVEPLIPITDYITEHLRDAMPLKEVQKKILTSLYNGQSIGIVRLNGGNARLLGGHSVNHDLDCLRVYYPDHLIRDTAKYSPLMKTNLVSHSLKYLTNTYLGYEIQTRAHDPYEDCVSAMRLYMRMRAQVHDIRVSRISDRPANSSSNGELSPWDMKGLDKLTPDELFEMSRPGYKCWCLDSITLL
ncbi:hypothetical protein Drorol1_Dr00007887 [Drosera rotundifolia]